MNILWCQIPNRALVSETSSMSQNAAGTSVGPYSTHFGLRFSSCEQRPVCICICIYICMYIYIYMQVYTPTHVYMHRGVCRHIQYVYMCVCISVVYASNCFLSLSLYIYIYIHIYIYICTYSDRDGQATAQTTRFFFRLAWQAPPKSRALNIVRLDWEHRFSVRASNYRA